MIADAESFIETPSRAGQASLGVEWVDGLSAATDVESSSPLKLLVPRSRGRSVWAYTSSFGGGLVAGDQTRLQVRVGDGARCLVGTQASTKVYRNPELRPCGHETRACVGAGSLLVFAPDPVQPFATSSYVQRQEFHLAPDASLALVDWFSSGRSARGERWQFQSFQSRNAVYRSGGGQSGDEAVLMRHGPETRSEELMFLDSLLLSAEDGFLGSQHRTGRFNCFATLLLLGPALNALSAEVMAHVAQQPVRPKSSLLCCASPLGGGVVLRVAGEEVEAVGRELHRHLASVTALLGDDPWVRKW